ncbi:50S ribosomal protein L15 [Candidatus Uhrbacteria bacterium CG10_big_fil_rev_8_21_14_0_10_48_11]|uniref:Large ribosomal subunit protein uL15 n=1 Tax=Candidatus Uhrbacteria bacterium CG10_big_fil_rev_8_21_14_0_10_48_11 TaxID=1975037 RepID=A0A2M8LEY6_9BACT|nr:MAG: 50S ribosomal protein L15 [Candidatus Uhrbacteria bacterium CG10_big_fil_rev_8_21_14_0_10_48_11]
MVLSLSTLKTNPKRSHRRVGRGNGSGRGSYAGRGLKGQKSRTGGSRGLKRLSMQQFFRRIPKTGGFTHNDKQQAAIGLSALAKAFPANATITPQTLVKKNLVPAGSAVKILNNGTLEHALTIRGCQVSASAVEVITKAGGKVIPLT